MNWRGFTPYGSMKDCLEAVKSGEVDGCMLNQFAIILLVILIGVIVACLVTYARNRNYKAQRDQMTGLYNRTSAKK